MPRGSRGRINSGGYSITAGSLLVPEIFLLNIPFLFKDQQEQDCVLDNHLTKITSDMFLKKGVVMISWSEVGVVDIWSGEKAYVSPDDLKGLRARSAPDEVAGFMWSQFGANPNPLPVTEWNSSNTFPGPCSVCRILLRSVTCSRSTVAKARSICAASWRIASSTPAFSCREKLDSSGTMRTLAVSIGWPIASTPRGRTSMN